MEETLFEVAGGLFRRLSTYLRYPRSINCIQDDPLRYSMDFAFEDNGGRKRPPRSAY